MNGRLLFSIVMWCLGHQVSFSQTTTTWNGSAWSNGDPDANKDVVISSGTFTTSSNSNIHCKNLTIHSGATLVVLAGETFSVSGVVTNDGTLTNNGHLMLRSCGKYSVTDVDGNSYATVQIGTQCWTQSNLTVSKYRNGDSISNITNGTALNQTNRDSTGAWCNYNNDASNGTTYGKLYNWYAVNDSRGLCPAGWHIPTDAEWETIEHFLDSSTTGGKMKSTGTTLWNSPNTSASNSSGFSGLPGGYNIGNGNFGDLRNNGSWWSRTVEGPGWMTPSTSVWFRRLNHNGAVIARFRTYHFPTVCFSVRCLRD